MLIGIDGNEANVSNKVGIGQYAYNVLVNIYKSDKKNKYIIYLKDKPRFDLPPENDNWHYCVFGPKPLWTKIALPLHLFFQKQKLNLFYTPNHYSPLFTPCPVVATIHDLGYLKFPEQFNKKDLYQLKNWTEKSIRRTHHLIAVSEFTKNEIIKIYKTKENQITVAYNGVGQPAKVDSRISQKILKKFDIKAPYFLYLGTLKPNKNIPFLIDAFNNLNNDNYQLVIAGKKGWLYDEIFEKIKEKKLIHKVVFTGFINEIEKWALYKNAISLVIPSLYEGFGIPVIEAQKIGTPVIASDIPVFKEVIENSGILINPHQTDSLTQALKKITNKKIRKSFVKKGKKQAQKFTWENTAKTIIKVFQK